MNRYGSALFAPSLVLQLLLLLLPRLLLLPLLLVLLVSSPWRCCSVVEISSLWALWPKVQPVVTFFCPAVLNLRRRCHPCGCCHHRRWCRCRLCSAAIVEAAEGAVTAFVMLLLLFPSWCCSLLRVHEAWTLLCVLARACCTCLDYASAATGLLLFILHANDKVVTILYSGARLTNGATRTARCVIGDSEARKQFACVSREARIGW